MRRRPIRCKDFRADRRLFLPFSPIRLRKKLPPIVEPLDNGKCTAASIDSKPSHAIHGAARGFF
jgi:hypothetical protein